MLVCFFKSLATEVGIYGGGCRGCPFLQSVIPWRIYGIRLGDALFCNPQLESNCFSLSHVSPPLWQWDMCGTSLVGFPHSLWHDGEVHDTPVAIIFPVGSSLAESLDAHLICLEDAFFVASFRSYQSTWVWDVSWIVYIFYQQARRGFLSVALSIENLRLVETL